MKHQKSTDTILTAAVLILAITVTSAFAQTEAEAADASLDPPNRADAARASTVEEIVVTAEKRQTRLQETPTSILAIGESTLEDASIFDVNDLAKVAPGLVVTDEGPGQFRISLRGIRSPGEPQVAIYYDEAPLAGAPGTTSDSGRNQGNIHLFDVQRIELLRGPQGTLYGASSMGGTLRIIYNKPDFDYSSIVDLIGSTTAHAGGNYQVNAMVNVPVMDEVLAVRAVLYRQENSGWIDNPSINQTKINEEETQGARILLRALPTSWLSLDLAFHYYDTEAANPIWAPSYGRFISPNRALLDFYDESSLLSVTANADLGFANLVLTGSYQDRDSLFTRDPSYLTNRFYNNAFFCRRHFEASVCATPEGMSAFSDYIDSFESVQYVSPQTMENLTTEARLQSEHSDFATWTIGGYWSKRDAWVGSNGTLADSMGRLLPNEPLVYTRQVRDELKQLAGFGEISIFPIEDLTVTFGTRYYDYSRSVAGDTQKGFDLINFSVQPWTERVTKEDGWLYKANISYQTTPDIMVYGQAASGFRPGGANQVLGLPDSFTPYYADSLTTYEAGVKTTLFDRKMVFNVAGFLTNWDDLQVSGSSGTFAFLTNAGSARIKGLEVEAVAVPLDGLQFTGNIVLLSAELLEDQVNDLVQAEGKKGDRIPYIPEVSYSIAGEYHWDINSNLQGMLRGDLSYVGRSYGAISPEDASYIQIGDYTVVSARTGISNDRWAAYLFVTNLFDELAITSASAMIGSGPATVTTVQPRTVGLELKLNF